MKVVKGSDEITRGTIDLGLKRRKAVRIDESTSEWMVQRKMWEVLKIQNWWIVAKNREIHGIKFYWKPRSIVGYSDIDNDDDKEIVLKSWYFCA